MLDRVGQQRNIFHIGVESSKVLSHDYGKEGILIELIAYQKQQKVKTLIAQTNGHANWIAWKS